MLVAFTSQTVLAFSNDKAHLFNTYRIFSFYISFCVDYHNYAFQEVGLVYLRSRIYFALSKTEWLKTNSLVSNEITITHAPSLLNHLIVILEVKCTMS